ncbi:FecR family protein [Snuella sedimenti]|uniref:FecR family protein n=1 Tax=Snuella sedimenti TaxID=2798802 RepID=A0A8J7J2D4_9FLAO|nr:FecR domain-containing protein [Snuella sedimenti]MBJ6366908.1 FecR family protein [Snuella sedimenti]
MEPYSRYLEDSFFIEWVYKPTQDSDRFWQNYIYENPEERDVIIALKELLLSLKVEPFVISKKEKDEILRELLIKVATGKKTGKIHYFIRRYYKYAALLLVFIAIGFLINEHFYKSTKLPFNNINIVALDSINSTRLTFGTGENVFIEEKESLIEFNGLGNIVVNQNDTISNGSRADNKEIETLNTLITPYGKRSKVALSDGTVAYLNAGTQFVFPEKFIGSKRTVFLSGEAFFEVSPNKEKPFIVQTVVDELSIEVVGTKFNVSAYPSDQDVLTVLTEGKVNVVEDNVFKKDKTFLSPGQLAVWNKEEERVKVRDVNTDNYTLWIQGLLHFESEPLFNVIKKIERFYNVEVTFNESADKLMGVKISGKLDLKEDLNKTLQNLMITADFNFEKINTRKYMIK